MANPDASKQIDRLVMPLFALLLILGIVSSVSIFTDHYSFESHNAFTGRVVGYGDFEYPGYEKEDYSVERFELDSLGPNVVESGSHVLINLYAKNFEGSLVTINIYDKPYFGRKLVMQMKSAVHTKTHASFFLPKDLEPGNYFVSVGEGNKESLRKALTVK